MRAIWHERIIMDILNRFPFFELVGNHEEAEMALSVLTCFGNEKERRLLKPLAMMARHQFIQAIDDETLALKVNRILAEYLHKHGDFSEQLTIFLGKCRHVTPA